MPAIVIPSPVRFLNGLRNSAPSRAFYAMNLLFSWFFAKGRFLAVLGMTTHERFCILQSQIRPARQ